MQMQLHTHLTLLEDYYFVTEIYCDNNQNLIASRAHGRWSLKKPAYVCENPASSGSPLYICSWKLAVCTLIVIKNTRLHGNWSMSATPHSALPTTAQSYRVFVERLAVFMRISCKARSSDPLSWWVDGWDPASRWSSSSGIDGTAHTPLSSHLPMHSWHNLAAAATHPPWSPLSTPLFPPHFPWLPRWGIKWYYEERLLAEFNCITRTGNIPWECVCARETRGETKVEGTRGSCGCASCRSKKEREKEKGGLKWIVNSNALITVKAVDKEHLQTPTRNTLGPAKGHLALSDARRLSATLFLSLWRQLS